MTGQRKQTDASQPRSGTVVDARMSLALWLRTGRTERGLSLVDVARITKIQSRILERLEGGKLDGLPAEVFVRGFIKNFAKCCGLDETEALTRYSAASQAQLTATAPVVAVGPSTLAAPPAARAMVDAMSDLAPHVSRNTPPVAFAALVPAAPIEVVDHSVHSVHSVHSGRSGRSDLAAGSLEMPIVEAAPAVEEPESTESTASTTSTTSTAKKKRRGGKRAKRKSMATGTPSVPTPVVVERIDLATLEAMPVEVVEAPIVEAAPIVEDVVVDQLDPLVEAPSDAHEDIVATPEWQPKMPPITTTASVPWRRPAYVATSTAAGSVPTLVIDDADPDSAEQVLEDRAAARSALTNAAARSMGRSFLPPILLDREDRSARQGGLTLAVIILLIAATLTLSYLMRRPSSSGDGVTAVDVETQLIG